MNRIMRNLLLICLTSSIFIFTSIASAQPLVITSGRYFSKNMRVHTDCPQCRWLIDDYDDAKSEMKFLEAKGASSKKIDELQEEIYGILRDLDSCEDYYCGYLYHQTSSPLATLAALYTLQLGFMWSYLHTNQTAHLDEFFATASNSLTASQATMGLLVRLLLGQFYGFRPAITWNMEKILSPSLYIINLDVNGNISSVRLNNNWIARILLGLESPIYRQFSAGIGIGAARLNQSVDTNTVGDRFSRTNISYIPTVAAYLAYYVCTNCLLGNGFVISAQVAADHYPNFSVNDRNPVSQTPINTNISQGWQYTGSLILSTNLNLP